jgi:MFS family permease
MYLAVMATAVIFMVPAIIYADRRNRLKQVFVAGLCLLAAAQVGMFFTHVSVLLLAALLAVYFTGFNILEASLPSLVSRVAPADIKGTALGAYSTSQYLGAFIGGVSGGWLYGHVGPHAVFAYCAALACLWLLIAAGMRNPRAVSTRLINVGPLDEGAATRLAGRLAGIEGVVEASVVAADGVAYIKVDRARVDDDALAALLAEPA